MIHYTLRCTAEHAFEGWFRDSAAFETQSAAGLVVCPECSDTRIVRGLMAPAIPRKGVRRTRSDPTPEAVPPAEPAPSASVPSDAVATGLPDQMRAVLQRIRAEVERTSDYVGPKFADEARRIHRGEIEQRSIYGESSAEEAEALADEGITVTRIPWVKPADS